jgi:hypothetical protein
MKKIVVICNEQESQNEKIRDLLERVDNVEVLIVGNDVSTEEVIGKIEGLKIQASKEKTVFLIGAGDSVRPEINFNNLNIANTTLFTLPISIEIPKKIKKPGWQRPYKFHK